MLKSFSVEKIVKYNIIFLFLFLPIWGVVSAQMGSFILNKEIFGALKYIFIIVLVLFTFINITLNYKKFSITVGQTPFVFFVFFASLHVIGEVHTMLLLDGLRYELLFMVMALFLFFSNYSIFPNLHLISKVVFFQGLVVIIFGIWQFFDITILEKLYRVELQEIGNIKLAISYRVISLLENPINLGAYLTFLFISIIYLSGFVSIKYKLFLYILIVIIAFLVIGTLSRLAFISFISVLFIYFTAGNKLKYNIIYILLILSLIIIIGSFLYDEYGFLLERFSNLSDSNEYTKNARIFNWMNAILSMDFIHYIWGYGLGMSSPTGKKILEYGAIGIENGYISILIQYGIIGLVFYLSIFVRFVLLGFLIKKYDKSLSIYIFIFVVFFAFMSLGNDFYRNSPFVFYFWYLYVYIEKTYLELKRKKMSV